ncbi:hypothetical protein [Streptomyces sp. SID12488]|nr:hypothetical protein [Streptomyces sp. SID12488]
MTVRTGIDGFGRTGHDNRLLDLRNLTALLGIGIGITEHVATRR